MDLAKYWGVVGQRKMSCAATGKGSPELWWWHQKIYELWNISLLYSMVVVTLKSHRGSPDLIPRMSQIYSPLLQRNWRVKTMRGGITSLCAGESADSCRMRRIETNYSRLKPGPRRGHVTNQLSWATAWLLVTCGSSDYLVVNELRPCILWPLMMGWVVLLTFF